MGVDISGFVEVRPWATWPDLPEEIAWEASICLDQLNVTRDYDSFGCLFGVMNHAGFRPVAAERGLPRDVSPAVRAVYDGTAEADPEHAGLWPSWVGWEELEAIDPDEPAATADARLHEYHREPDGQWQYRGKAAYSRELLERKGLQIPAPPWPEGTAWTIGDAQYRAVRLTRGQAITERGAWGPVFEVMRLLSRLHGPSNCRLIVWFDR